MLGFAEVIGGQFVGMVRDKTSNRIANILIIVLTSIAVAFLILFVTSKDWNILVYFLLFFWGFQDSSLNVIINTILGFEFESK